MYLTASLWEIYIDSSITFCLMKYQPVKTPSESTVKPVGSLAFALIHRLSLLPKTVVINDVKH